MIKIYKKQTDINGPKFVFIKKKNLFKRIDDLKLFESSHYQHFSKYDTYRSVIYSNYMCIKTYATEKGIQEKLFMDFPEYFV